MSKLIYFIAAFLISTSLFATRDHFFLIGSPGAGKGTFTQFLTKHGDYIHISIGDMLRSEITKNTEIGKQIADKVRAGDMVDQNIVFALFEQNFASALKKNQKIIVDGMLHSKEHIVFFDKIIKKYNLEHSFNYVYLSIPRQIAAERLKERLVCQNCSHVTNSSLVTDSICPNCSAHIDKRMDDSATTINKRLDRFYRDIVPLIAYYTKREGFKEHDSSKEYADRINEYLETYLNGH